MTVVLKQTQFFQNLVRGSSSFIESAPESSIAHQLFPPSLGGIILDSFKSNFAAYLRDILNKQSANKNRFKIVFNLS